MIPTRERWEILRRTLDALEAQTEKGFETIVVVDGEDQRIPPLPYVRVLQQGRAGPGAARNRGVGESERQLVLFLNDDMVPQPDLVARHLARHQARQGDETAVLGRVVWHRDVPRDRLHRWLDWSEALFDYRALDEQRGEEAGWTRFYSCNVSLKRRLFLDAEGFDTEFRFDYEDLDLAWRLHNKGIYLIYEPTAIAEHLHPYNWQAVERRYQSRARAERLMIGKHVWFRPWFRDQMESAQREPRVSRAWTLAVDLVPRSAGRLRRACERRADRHYRQRLAPAFLSAWDADDSPGDEWPFAEPNSVIG